MNYNINDNSNLPKKDAEEMAIKFASNFPKVTAYNNTKSRKYFSSNSKQDSYTYNLTIKDNLLHTCSEDTNINQIGTIVNKYSKHRKNSSNILFVSKEIGQFAEKKSTPKVLYKIPAKLMEEEDIYIESEDEETSEDYKNKFKHHNKTLDNYPANLIEDSILKEKLNSTDLDFLNANNILKIDFDSLHKVGELYTILLKEIEAKKINQEEFDKIVFQFFEVFTNSYDSIYNLEQSLNDKTIQTVLKQYFILELIIFSLIFKRGLETQTELTVALMNGFKNCIFHLNQNLIILMFICSVLFRKNIQESNTLKFKECKLKVDENKIWLNKYNYKKILRANNKSVLSVLKNILKQIKQSHKEQVKINPSSESSLGIELRNIGIILNYMKNIQKFQIQVVRSKLYTYLVSEKNSIIIQDEKVISNIDEVEVENTNNTDNLSNINIIPPSFPFLPEKVEYSKSYTLVLDLDETLVHYVEDEESAYIQIRPGAENFLEEMSEFYEIVVFTAAMQDVNCFLFLVCGYSLK